MLSEGGLSKGESHAAEASLPASGRPEGQASALGVAQLFLVHRLVGEWPVPFWGFGFIFTPPPLLLRYLESSSYGIYRRNIFSARDLEVKI